MLASTTQFTDMMDGVEQTYAFTVEMDLPGDVFPDVSLAVEELTIEATDNNSTVPDQSRYQTGIPNMQATLTLSGQVDPTDPSKTAAWAFRRWNPDSPLKYKDALRCAARINLGMYPEGARGTPELIRKATMWVDDYTTDKDGNVVFSLLDRWSTLRNTPQLPAVVTPPPYNSGLTSEFVVDWLMRAASGGTISSCRPRRPDCFIAAGMRASVHPEVGTLVLDGSGHAQPVPIFGPGTNGSALTNINTTDTSSWPNLKYQGEGSLDRHINVIADVKYPDGGATSIWLTPTADGSGTEVVVIILEGDIISVSFPFAGIGSPPSWGIFTGLPSVGAEYHVEINMVLPAVGGTATTGSIEVNGVLHTQSTVNWSSARLTTDWQYAQLNTNGAFCDWQITSETSPTSTYDFTPQAVIGPSLNPLQAVPAIDSGQSVRDVIQTIGAAELALAYFDESGIFRYVNRRQIRQNLTVARTLTSSTSLASLDEETIAAAVINRARPGYTGWEFGDAAQLWSLSKPWHIPPHSVGARAFVRTVHAPSGTLWADIDETVALLPDSGISVAGRSYYRAATSGAGLHNHPGLIITPVLLSSTTLQITIENHYNADAWLVASADNTEPDASTPVLIIGGIPVTADNEIQVDYQYPSDQVVGSNGLTGAAGTRFGEVPWDDTGNQWRQDADATLELAKDVVCDGVAPRPNLNNITLAFADPRLQLSDLVELLDPDTTLVADYGRIFGWSLNWSASERSMTIDGRTLAPPFGWIGGLTGRSEGGATTFGYSGAA